MKEWMATALSKLRPRRLRQHPGGPRGDPHHPARLGLPVELRRSLACTNIIENMNATTRRVCRNVKRRRDARMALRWTAAMPEAAKEASGALREAHEQLPLLRAALLALRPSTPSAPALNSRPRPHSLFDR
jgi:hypothetical protein